MRTVDDLYDMRHERAELVKKLEKKTERKDWSESDRLTFDRIKNQIDTLDEEMRMIERPVLTPEQREGIRPWIGGPGDCTPETESRGPVVGPGITYRSLFGEPTSRGGFDKWEKFVLAMESGELRSLQAGVPSGAGFVVPSAFAAELIGPMLEDSVALSRCRVFPVERAGSISIPGWDVTSHASSLYGGVTASWTAEGGTISETDHKTRSVTLAPKKLVASTSLTRELEQDSFSGFAKILQDSLRDAVAYYADDAILWGEGASQPVGVMNASALVSVAKESAQEADTLVAANIGKMWSRLLPQCASRAVWICSPSVLPELYQMSVVAGTAAFGVFQPAGGFSQAPYASLMGRPLIVSEKMKALGDQGDILLADFTMYGVGLAQEVRLDRSEHVHWSTDKSAYRAIVRLDGAPLLNSAITPKRGSATLSAFVTLDERGE